MKIKLLSDLHLEFYKDKVLGFDYLASRDEDVLVLAGDIAVGANRVLETIDLFLNYGHKKIVYVPGNHEFYGSSYTETMLDLEEGFRHYDNAFMLNSSNSVVIDDVAFFGGTLWTNFNEDPVSETLGGRMISDFKVIEGFKTKLAKHLYYTDLVSIERNYRKYETLKKVVVTHFLPCRQVIHEKYLGNILNDYFANNLGLWIETLENTTWLFGHTHDCVDQLLGSTRLVCNPHGYPGEYNDFKDQKIIEV